MGTLIVVRRSFTCSHSPTYSSKMIWISNPMRQLLWNQLTLIRSWSDGELFFRTLLHKSQLSRLDIFLFCLSCSSRTGSVGCFRKRFFTKPRQRLGAELCWRVSDSSSFLEDITSESRLVSESNRDLLSRGPLGRQEISDTLWVRLQRLQTRCKLRLTKLETSVPSSSFFKSF